MTAKPVFLLGFGAMKAGTTWLYRYLRDNELVSFGPSKEMHAWTMYFDPSRSRISLRLGNALKGYVCADARRAGVARAELLREVKLTSFGLDPSSYLRLFQQLAASHSRPVADITPDYSRLHPQQVSSIRDFLEPHFELRPLFLMRDPVDRLFSDCKHVARHHSAGSSSDTVVTGVSLFRAKLDRRDRLPGGLKGTTKNRPCRDHWPMPTPAST
ncbi:hypothetical protein [Synechococcus sp. CCY9202]|uniref:hypothetical protein n=1 Tax=Synechococcus sp. CCY9202 TaxID=174698 RepID=UPI002B22198D|nr:hypothetical protein [Synechococcus sp. CCY9202]MEA5423860.1 hypothetical protein [Synechococcus sp. CCY9202]